MFLIALRKNTRFETLQNVKKGFQKILFLYNSMEKMRELLRVLSQIQLQKHQPLPVESTN